LGSDLRKIDAHVVGERDYAEVPELSDDWFDKAVAHEGGKPLRRGRPKAASPKQQITLRLDREVLDRFRDGGEGWQSRINSALRKAVGI
jgi:uncharacterized protein (DUF4415 family)